MENNNITEIHERVYVHLLTNYPHLRFTLRQKDRGERLSNGYWFTGDDNYLAFSFWEGTDWRNKTSNIFFSIDKDGTSWLNFVSNDDDENGKKSKFLEQIAKLMGMFKRPKRNEDPTKQDWVKKYEGENYQDSIDAFIKGDKKIIDLFIKEESATFFSSISEENFEKWKERIEREREKIEIIRKNQIEKENQETETIPKSPLKELPKRIQLNQLTLKNIKLFKKEQSLIFHERLTCIIGWNGSGKTSLLRSIVLGLTGYEQDESFLSDNGKLTKLQQLLTIEGELESSGAAKYADSGFIDLSYTIDDLATSNRVLFKTENNEPQIRDADAFKSIKGKNYNCLVLAFPQEKGGGKDKQVGSISEPNTEDTRAMLYDEPDNRFEKFAAWLRRKNKLSNDKKVKGESVEKEEKLIKIAFEIINKIAGEEVHLHKIVVTDKDTEDPIWVIIGDNAEPILLDIVSQGYNNVFGWVGYLITRLSEVADKLEVEDFMKIPAIVLIDEIDTYLHPTWQSRVLAVLVETFSNIQFVVTTHSPYVVGSVQSDKIKIYRCEKGDMGVVLEDDIDTESTYGASVDILTEDTLGGFVRVPEVDEAVRKLRNAVLGNRFEEAESLIVKLQENLKVVIEKQPTIKSLITLLNSKKRMADV